MTRSIVDGSQNVEVSVKLPSQKPVGEQLEIMEEYTRVHRESSSLSRERRELNCLKVIYPRLFRSIEEQDRLAGRLDFLPIGFGCVTSLGGVGHYCVFDKLRAMKDCFQSDEDKARIEPPRPKGPLLRKSPDLRYHRTLYRLPLPLYGYGPPFRHDASL